MVEANPLLTDAYTIPFSRIRAQDVEPGIREALAQADAEIDDLADDGDPPTWRNTMQRLDSVVSRVYRRLTPVTHLTAVAETPELRDAYNAVLPEISSFWSGLPLRETLWRRIQAFAASDEGASLGGVRRRHLEKTVREFRRAGAELPPAEKERLRELRVELATSQQRFSENVLDATADFELLVEDGSRLAGVPEAALARARAKAVEKGMEGWLLTLDHPSVEPVLKYCRDRALRRSIHGAYVGRCRGGVYDNRALLVRILALRHELAELLGYASFPDYQLEDRMARRGAVAEDFERDMADRTRPFWERDVAELEGHARGLGLDALQPWDALYVMEHLRRERYAIDDEELRPYFPLDRVLTGLFQVAERCFGLRIEERGNDEVWHPDVRFYEVTSEDDGTFLGSFYTDWFPRKNKRSGAWMNDFVTGGPTDGGFEPHLGVICGNFTPPGDGGVALLTHREVETTFHEFGHLLHHCTSRVEVRSRSGINVAWDWVELPSQLMENWCWEREALDLFARHHESGEPLPEDLYRRMVSARRFMGGWEQMRQLAFGTLDLRLHADLAPRLPRSDAGDVDAASEESATDAEAAALVMAFAKDTLAEFTPGPAFAESHPLASFTHLFAGGYAAGYYSYLWSEVLDADVFTRFRDEGVFNRMTGSDYVASILSRGDSADPEELFREFLGRGPDPTALIERNLGPAPS